MSEILMNDVKVRSQALAMQDMMPAVSLPILIEIEEHNGLKRPAHIAYIHL